MRRITKLFNRHSVSVFGAKGSGKDMLTANVIARRLSKAYVSNIDYKIKGKLYIPIDFTRLMINNNYNNFIYGTINPYVYCYPESCDIYISDCGVYFPSQYNGELNKCFRDMPSFMALSRQLGDVFVHTNAQNFNRVWDKIREQSDIYINTLSCVVIGKLVVQRVRLYERYQSACDNIVPFSYKTTKLIPSKEEMNTILQAKLNHQNKFGKITERVLIYFNKSNYDTRYFKTLLGGVINE